MAASPDLISILEIRVQVYDAATNTYLWHNWWVPQSWTEPFEGDWLHQKNVLNIAHFKIPNKNAVFTWKIKGQYALTNGTWVLKVKVGDSETNCIEYTPTLNNGEWELTLPALGENNACWVWYSHYVHTPANFKGLKVHNCMRVTSGP